MARSRRKKRPPIATASSRSIISPAIDTLCCGGLSFLVIGGYLLYRLLVTGLDKGEFEIAEFTLASALVNWPHFMASYRLLYSSREQVLQHKWASIGVPAVLLAVVVYALLTPSGSAAGKLFVNEQVAYGLFLVSAFYLAWHYTGQAWGMVSAFAFVEGIRMDNTERRLIRSGMRLLLVWHVVWFAQDFEKHFPINLPFNWVYLGLAVVGLGTLVAGAIGFRHIWKRTGQKPSLRMIAPWASIYLWYALLFVQPQAFFWVQISHALQYLIFPIRVELNRHPPRRHKAAAGTVRAFAYYLILVAAGWAVFHMPGQLVTAGNAQYNLASMIAAVVNIHHYFVDGVIWKIRNPAVQRDLFAHFEK